MFGVIPHWRLGASGISVTQLLLAFAICLGTILLYKKSSKRDPYGLFHLRFNREPGGSEAPKTEWLNQGYWKNTNSFPRACRALALKLLEVVKLEPGEAILDVGHGTGESLIMFLTDSTVPRPSRLTGITSLVSQHTRANERVSQVRSSSGEAAKVPVQLYHGDAICRDASSPSHPLHPLNEAKFDVVFVLDCAYHFATRREFLEQAYRKLVPGGRIVLGDLCFGVNSVPTGVTTFLTTKIMGLIPKENVICSREYVRSIEELGYTDVVVEDITPDVFQGLFKFLSNNGLGWWMYASFMGWYRRTAEIRFVVIAGRKPLM